jgi:hypothetical protein
MRSKPRIAILAHSTNPRGGVVHSLELGDALTRLGHEVTVFAPDPAGKGFFRDTVCRTVCVPASPVGKNVREMVEIRVADYLRYFSQSDDRRFDVWHAQDGISGNVLATLKERGQIPAFARTVHHIDSFDDTQLCALQLRSIRTADRRLVVSRLWKDYLARELALDAALVGNGVDTQRFSPEPNATDEALRARLGLPPPPRRYFWQSAEWRSARTRSACFRHFSRCCRGIRHAGLSSRAVRRWSIMTLIRRVLPK